MKEIELKKISHSYKRGDTCPEIKPNVKEDSIFLENGEPIGFFIKEIAGKLLGLIEIANKELLSKNVPKSTMHRVCFKTGVRVEQHSTIIGSVPPKPHMRRPYPSTSLVHMQESAKNFIKAMLMASYESEGLIKKILPKQYEKQKSILKKTDKKWRFGNLFTSSISNYNISAPFHQDNANLKETVNVIITKRDFSTGGNLYLPDYDACIDQCDNSNLVYPAWKNLHGVTPIVKKRREGYRNSLVFYPLAAFERYST